MDIQVDMFEVQLGAAILLQFKVGADRIVTVLADGGTSGGSYGADHVLEKLKTVLPIQDESSPPRIDLLIGTHYDADHLNRLVPVIDAYEIGDAWMPPIANDAKQPAADWEGVRWSNLLGPQLTGVSGDSALAVYLQAKRGVIERASRARQMLVQRFEGDGFKATYTPNFYKELHVEEGDVSESYFLAARAGDQSDAEDSHDHACKEVRPPTHLGVAEEMEDAVEIAYGNFAYLSNPDAALMPGNSQERNLSYIGKAAAKDALAAMNLKKVVDALARKNVSVRYQYVSDGEPSSYAWNEERESFVRAKSPKGLALTLLGPSKGLIAKYWKRLPVGEYVGFALKRALPVESITPQNELSYSMIFSYENQGVLISGDTGFVDFVSSGGRFSPEKLFPNLIEALKVPLPVVQVAHHGGHNKYFYHALQAAGYPLAGGVNYLLLSHEEKSAVRPSEVFSEFVGNLDMDPTRIQILFTSKPRKDLSYDYKDLFGPVVPTNGEAKRGDVRLIFSDGEWSVVQHAVTYG
ncbi:hypothetical protein [Stenotrophomonas oahuensis]|uniref:Metallo-beta-lactamase domain-containing protein n=1 Tax=Stenotrophomonas oahuensis TaxID=3003271 RepID=A0ABY9YT91_9GAMM|nr:hypothetical protein [Stenotrophomonas sp. A5586]WNH54178.1 hypothetical protein PDM29_07860 [Stenotrophomonas sp. A5586]